MGGVGHFYFKLRMLLHDPEMYMRKNTKYSWYDNLVDNSPILKTPKMDGLKAFGHNRLITQT